MTQIGENSDKGPQQPLIPAVPMKFVGVGAQVGCLTLVVVLLSVFCGLWLDRILGTKPAITIILLLSSAPVALALTFWVAKRAIKDLNPQPPEKAQTSTRKEEETSD